MPRPKSQALEIQEIVALQVADLRKKALPVEGADSVPLSADQIETLERLARINKINTGGKPDEEEKESTKVTNPKRLAESLIEDVRPRKGPRKTSNVEKPLPANDPTEG